MSELPVLMISGEDEALIFEAIRTAIDDALDGEDKALALEELKEDDYRSGDLFDVSKLVDSAQTAPFLTKRRVVVGRHIGRFTKKDDVEPLVEYLSSPLDSTSLILVWEKGVLPRQQRLSPMPKNLISAIESAGGKIEKLAIGRGKAADKWLLDRLNESPVELTQEARREIIDRLGEDRSRGIAVLDLLSKVYSKGILLELSDVEPYLGKHGGVTPWELTDSIEVGDIPRSMRNLQRMLRADERHPLAVLALLHSYYEKLLRLEGSGVSDETTASEILGVSPFPAKKALISTRKLGKAKIFRSIELIAQADLDLRGKTGWPPELVVEVLVARLTAMSRK